MVKSFSEEMDKKASWRALQMWQVLIGCAYNQQLTTYGQLAEVMGDLQPRHLANILGRIMFLCEEEGLPPLTVLVVKSHGGSPGSGFDLDDSRYGNLDEARMDVFKADWYRIVPPTADDFQQVWERAKAAGRVSS
jgi:alkylated DNA nucleotide flippase Atl1